jgi:hypothetical protein
LVAFQEVTLVGINSNQLKLNSPGSSWITGLFDIYNNMEIVTTDLSKYGYRELEMAIELLKAYTDQRPEFLGNNISLNFNTYSGNVFLSDDDYNTGMVGGTELKQWVACGCCGREGFIDEKDDTGKDVFINVSHCVECQTTEAD